jgi:capsular exopolysaccharide synthesis family protein
VQRAREVEAEAERTFAEIAQRAGPAHPKYAAAETELALARANTRRLVQTIVSSVEKEFTAARATEKSIEAAIAQARGQIQSMNRKEIELGALEREVSTNRQVYQTFLSRLRETTAAKELEVANARVTDPALPATNPVRPRSALIVGASGAVGAALGVLLAIVLRRFDNRVNTSRDVEDRLGQRLLAALPKVRLTDRSVMSRLVLDSPHTPFAEAIRTAGTAILLDSPQSAKQALVVTSALPGEGKSTFATNFALWQARTQKVLLVEADLRRPSIPTALAVPSEQKGLVEYLNGSASLNDCIMTSQHTSLHLMVCGRVPQNPLELLVSSRFKDAVARLRDMYDLIVFNAPPVQVVADALAIGAQATGMIFVVKAGDTPISLCRRAIRRTGAATVPILGVVLNQLDYEKAERYYGDDTGFGRYESYATVIRSPDGR